MPLVIGGLTAVSWHSFFEHSDNQFLGDGLLIIGGILWAIYTVLAKKWNINSWDAVASISATSLFLWGPIILIFGNLDFSAQTASTWLFQGVTQGIVTSIVGLWLYSFAVQTLGASLLTPRRARAFHRHTRWVSIPVRSSKSY